MEEMMPPDWRIYKDKRYLYIHVKEIFENPQRDSDKWGVNAAPEAHSLLQLLDCRGVRPSPEVTDFLKRRISQAFVRRTAIIGLPAESLKPKSTPFTASFLTKNVNLFEEITPALDWLVKPD